MKSENMEMTARVKSRRFAIRIVKLYQYLCEEKREFVISKQLLRCGTSVGANLAEAECAISRKDYLTESQYESISGDCEEIRRMLSATTKTVNATLHSSHSTL